MQRVLEVRQHRDVACVVQHADTQTRFDTPDTGLGQEDIALVLVSLHIGPDPQLFDQRRYLGGVRTRLVNRAGDHQWNPRLIDEQRVRLVDQGELEGPMDHRASIQRQAIA